MRNIERKEIIFDECKEKIGKVNCESENQQSFVEDSFKKVSSRAAFQVKLQLKDVHVFPFDLPLLLL